MNKILLLLLLLISVSVSAQKKEYQLIGSILDAGTGESTKGIRVTLDRFNPSTKAWEFVEETITGSPERFLERKEGVDNKGLYKMTFYTQEHFDKQGVESVFPFIEVNVNISTDEDYMFPIIMTPFGYSTYRGNGYTEKKAAAPAKFFKK